MANKKIYAKKGKTKKTVMIKIAEKVGELAARVVNEKEHLAGIAGNAIKSVKATIHNATAEKKNAPRQKAAKKIAKPAAKKVAKAVKKTTPAKKASKKAAVKKK